MSISELEPGLYKIRIRSTAYMSRRKGRFNHGTAHIMQVTGHGKNRKYIIDNGPPENPETFLNSDNYEVVSKLQFPQVLRQYITLSWEDDKGDEYAFQVKDVWTLRNIFEQFPFLAKPFMYEPRRKGSK